MRNLRFAVYLISTLLLSGCSKPANDNAAPTQAPTVPAQSAASQASPPVAAQQTGPPPSAATHAAPLPRGSGEVTISPSQLFAGESAAITFRLKDNAGMPLADAQAVAVFELLGEKPLREQAILKWNGKEYVGKHAPSLAGEWDVNVEARKNGQLLLSMPSTIEVKPRK